MKLVTNITTSFLLLFAFHFASANSFRSEKINSACTKAFSNMGAKTNNFCACYSKNMNLLIFPYQLTLVLSYLENTMSPAQQTKNQALIDMEYEVSKECDNDPKWLSEKAQAIINSINNRENK